MLGIVNFAHGAFFAIGAYLALMLNRDFGWGAALLAPVFTGLIGMLVQFVLIRRLYGKEPLLGLILTFALALFFEAILRLVFGAAPLCLSARPNSLRRFRSKWSGSDHQIPHRRPGGDGLRARRILEFS